MIRFIKRFCYHSAKRLIRFFIYFTVIACLLSFSCSASSPTYNYPTFEALVGDGDLVLFGGMDYVIDYQLRELSSGFDDFQVFGTENERFNSFSVRVQNSSNLNFYVAPFDVFRLSHFIHIHSVPGSAFYTNDITDNVQLIVSTSIGDFILKGDNFVSDINVYHNDTFDNTSLYVNVDFTFPDYAKIYSIEYVFYNIFDSGLASCRFVPLPDNANNEGFFLYIGNKANAPLYPSFDDASSILDDTETSVDEFLADNDVNSSFEDFSNGFQNIFDNAGIVFAFQFLRDQLYYAIIEVLPIRYIIYFSIALGLISFYMSIGSSVTSFISRKFKD